MPGPSGQASLSTVLVPKRSIFTSPGGLGRCCGPATRLQPGPLVTGAPGWMRESRQCHAPHTSHLPGRLPGPTPALPEASAILPTLGQGSPYVPLSGEPSGPWGPGLQLGHLLHAHLRVALSATATLSCSPCKLRLTAPPLPHRSPVAITARTQKRGQFPPKCLALTSPVTCT